MQASGERETLKPCHGPWYWEGNHRIFCQKIAQILNILNVWSIYLHLGSLGGKCR